MTLEYFLSEELKSTIGKNKGLEVVLNDQFYFESLGSTHFTSVYLPAFPNLNIQLCIKPIRAYSNDGKLQGVLSIMFR